MDKNPPANAGDVGSIPGPRVLFPVPCRVSVLSKSSVTSDENGNTCLLIHKVKQYNGVQSRHCHALLLHVFLTCYKWAHAVLRI